MCFAMDERIVSFEVDNVVGACLVPMLNLVILQTTLVVVAGSCTIAPGAVRFLLVVAISVCLSLWGYEKQRGGLKATLEKILHRPGVFSEPRNQPYFSILLLCRSVIPPARELCLDSSTSEPSTASRYAKSTIFPAFMQVGA